MTFDQVLRKLKSKYDPEAVRGMARYGITAKHVCGGWSTPALRAFARELGKNHDLARQLWSTEILEARLLAGLIEEKDKVTRRQMEEWAKDFDSWALCDGTCLNLFRHTPFAYAKCAEWSRREEEFVKRAGFALMASLAVSDKTAQDRVFRQFLPLIRREALDGRNYVKKAVNWALRQIGKRNRSLNRVAIKTAQQIHALDSPSARWIAADALRELESAAVQQRLSRCHSEAKPKDLFHFARASRKVNCRAPSLRSGDSG